MMRVTVSNIPIRGVKSTCKSMCESVSNGCRSKEATFNFIPLTYNGEVTKLTNFIHLGATDNVIVQVRGQNVERRAQF